MSACDSTSEVEFALFVCGVCILGGIYGANNIFALNNNRAVKQLFRQSFRSNCE